MAYRYGQYRNVIPGLFATIKEAEELQKKFDIKGFLDTYEPGWEQTWNKKHPGWTWGRHIKIS